MNVFELIHRELTETTETDPTTIAITVVNEIDTADLRSALLDVLPGVVRTQMASFRGRLKSAVEHGDADDNPQTGQGHISSDDHPVGAPANNQPNKPGKPRLKTALQAWEARLRGERLAGESGYILLADATALDLLAAALRRRTQADTLVSNAEEYEKLAEALETHGAQHVRDLPPEVQRELLG